MTKSETFYVYLEDEAPRLGAGWRLVVAKIGWKWVRLYDRMGRTQRIKRGVWDNIITSQQPKSEEN